jgi:hypothetical protein
MRFVLALVAIYVAATASVRAGDSGGDELAMGGEAPPVCAFTATPSQQTADNMTFAASGGINQIQIDNLIDPNVGLLNRASIQLEVDGICNRAHSLSVMTNNGGLKQAGSVLPVGGAFVGHINYRVQVDWAGETATLTTDAVPGKKAPVNLIGGPNQGSLNISLIIDEVDNDLNTPVIAGVYSDILTIQIGAPL